MHRSICIYSSPRFTFIYNVVHCCCIISYGKSFTPDDIPVFDSADGGINEWKWDYLINETIFKTKEKYGFDWLIFWNDVLTLIKNYINFIRSRLSPCCDYVLISRNGKQFSKLSNVFERAVVFSYWKIYKADTI